MATDEIDEELLALQAELEGVQENGESVDNSTPQKIEEVVVAAKPAVTTRTNAQPEWLQTLYQRDYERLNVNKGVEKHARSELPRPAEPQKPRAPAEKPPAASAPAEPTALPAQPAPKKRKILRTAAGEIWEDPTLMQWPENDHRIFVGDLAGDATDEILTAAFQKFDSFQMARVIRDKRSHKCKGFGFVSFAKAEDMVKALREMNGKYVGNRPVKLRKSNWQERQMTKSKKEDVRIMRKLVNQKPA